MLLPEDPIEEKSNLAVLIIKAAIILAAIVFLVYSVHGSVPYEIGTKAIFYGFYQGWTTLSMTEYRPAEGQEASIMLTMLDRNKTYLILVYVVPKSWPDKAELFQGPPMLNNKLRGEFGA